MNENTLLNASILWIVDCGANPAPADPTELSASPLASQRMRVAAPARYLARLGWTQRAASIRGESDFTILLRATPSIAVFSKILANAGMEDHLERHERLAREYAKRGIPVVVDVCDNYFITAAAPYLTRMIAGAHRVVANSHATADLITEEIGVKPIVIGDPVESCRSEPAFKPPPLHLATRLWRRPGRPLNLLWYGGPLRSFEPLRMLLPELAHFSTTLPIDLHILTANFEEVETAVRCINSQGIQLRARFTPWSAKSVADAMSSADIVILPGDVTDQSRFGASANRLADALWAGRYVVASGIPSYWEFREVASVGDDVVAGIVWAYHRPKEVLRRIALGQQLIQEHYTPDAIGHAWWTLASEIIGT